MKPFEIMVVVNGSSDTTKEIAEGAGCRVVYYEEALGINIGRAIGAKKQKEIFCFFGRRYSGSS
ncbi:glycosyltransferase family A protein [Priestia megaterium]